MMEDRELMPYVAKILRDKLFMEEAGLKTWERKLTSQDPMTVRQAEGNIPSNKHRIMELQEAMNFLKTYKKTAP
jgi:hypothetical protein